MGLFSKEKISEEKSEEKISGKAYDVNKQMIYTVPKSTNESEAQYSLEPVRGGQPENPSSPGKWPQN